MHLVKEHLLPQEEILEVGKKQKKLIIGIPKESMQDEERVPLTPEAVENLVNDGHDVYIEAGAGKGSNYTDIVYSENGGIITDNKAEIFNADIILKVGPISEKEIDYLRERQIILSSLLLSVQDEKYFRKLLDKKVTTIAFEYMKDEYGYYPVMQSMSAIAGYTSIIIAGEYLSKSQQGKGVLLGGITGITPTEVVVFGAGTAAEFAIKAALGFGSSVKVFDNSVQRLKDLQYRLGQALQTSIYHPRILKKALKSADVLIGAVHLRESDNWIVTEDMVKEMKPGSVIIDLSINNGGCIETSKPRTHKDPSFIAHGIIHYCVPNIASRVARTASIALSNVLAPILMNIGNSGGVRQQLLIDSGLRQGVYIYNGILTNNGIGNRFDISSKDIDLLMAAF